jgi:hypothetical protein
MSTEEFEDTKGIIRIRISKKNRQHNGLPVECLRWSHRVNLVQNSKVVRCSNHDIADKLSLGAKEQSLDNIYVIFFHQKLVSYYFKVTDLSS